MSEIVVKVQHIEGLHARPAARFARLAGTFRSALTVLYGEHRADARSLLELLALGIPQGACLTLRAEGEDAEAALLALQNFLETEGEA